MIEFFHPSDHIFLNGMARIQARQLQAQQQLTTGLRINSISDDPDQISNLLQVRSALSRAQQIKSNLARAKTETDTAEGALQNAAKLLDRVSTLATQAQPTIQSADARAHIAGEIGSILQQLVGIADTSVEGRYLFSGDSDQMQPYTYDSSQAYPVSAYAGAAATRQIQHPDGSLYGISKTAQEIFDSDDPASNVFTVITSLRTALLNNDQAGIDGSLPNLSNASSYLNGELAWYGTVQNRVNQAIDFASTLTTQLQAEQSDIQDADLTEAITELNQAALQQQAALGAEGQMPRTNLFDYLG